MLGFENGPSEDINPQDGQKADQLQSSVSLSNTVELNKIRQLIRPIHDKYQNKLKQNPGKKSTEKIVTNEILPELSKALAKFPLSNSLFYGDFLQEYKSAPDGAIASASWYLRITKGKGTNYISCKRNTSSQGVRI